MATVFVVNKHSLEQHRIIAPMFRVFVLYLLFLIVKTSYGFHIPATTTTYQRLHPLIDRQFLPVLSSSVQYQSQQGKQQQQPYLPTKNNNVLRRFSTTASSAPSTPPTDGKKKKKTKQQQQREQKSKNDDDETTTIRSNSSSSSSNKNNPSSTSTRYYAIKALIPKKGSTAFAVDRLESSLNFSQLSLRDRAFCRTIVTNTERRLGQINSIIELCMKEDINSRRTNRVDQFVQATIRVGIVQLLFLNVPSHAAVKETIDVLRMDKDITVSESKIKFVNAILRRVDREREILLNQSDITMNASPWLIQQWKNDWGDDGTQKILEASMEESPRCLTVNQQVCQKLFQKKDEFKDSLLFEKSIGNNNLLNIEQRHVEYVASQFQNNNTDDDVVILPQGSILIKNPPPGTISTWPLYQEGAWWCQDPSATIPAIALYQAISQQGLLSVDDRHVIDLCSAPGGKAAQLSNYGFASITAVEISLKRTDRLKQNMQRLQMKWNIIIADGTKWSPREPVDGVLLDVPCTATGTASKRPDVLRHDSNINDLLQTQYQLACHALDEMLSIGGILVYATCSLLRQESEDQIIKLLKNRSDVQMIPFQMGEIPGFDNAIDPENGWIRVLPGQLLSDHRLNHVDGFFVARLEKIR